MREIPLRRAGGRTGTRPGETHNTALRAAYRNIIPAFVWRFIKIKGTVIYYHTLWRSARKLKRRT